MYFIKNVLCYKKAIFVKRKTRRKEYFLFPSFSRLRSYQHFVYFEMRIVAIFFLFMWEKLWVRMVLWFGISNLIIHSVRIFICLRLGQKITSRGNVTIICVIVIRPKIIRNLAVIIAGLVLALFLRHEAGNSVQCVSFVKLMTNVFLSNSMEKKETSQIWWLYAA